MQAEPAPIRSKAVTNGTTSARLGGARADFVGGLGRKVADLRATFARVRATPDDVSARDELRRKLHALSSAAKMMKFDAMDRALAEALGILDRAAREERLGDLDLDTVDEVIEDLPALAWGDPPARSSCAEPTAESAAVRHRVLVVGTPLIAEALLDDHPGASAAFTCESTPDPEAAFDLVRTTEPDLVIVDADLAAAGELVERLLDDPLTEAVPVIAVGSFLEPGEAARYVALGVAKTVSKPTSREALRAVCEETLSPHHGVVAVPAVLDEPTLEELGDRLASELREALVGRADPSARTRRIPLGEGTEVLGAVWAAIARVREIVVSRTDGQVRFAGGPEGALTPAGLLDEPEVPRADRHRPPMRSLATEVRLAGRRIVVADDDPAVVWFLADLLRTAGCVVHEAFDGEEALARAYETSPDLVISDILMPKLDGFSLCRALRRDVALRDTPVILLSWKEDLLQRVRELGAGAAAYVRKESDTRAIIARVREALRARGRIEARLREDVEVRGRLDGVSIRTLLEVVSASRPDARVSVRDATFLYEVEIRSGSPVRATRTDGGGRFLKGPKVLAQLLGVSAGRFTVTTSTTAIEADLEGSLEAQLAEPIARARAATTLLTGPRMHAVGRVRLDEQALTDYLEATPERARLVARRLANGASPRDLVLCGGCESALLDDLLCDLAARGLVTSVEGADGADLLRGEVTALLRPADPSASPGAPATTPSPALAEAPRDDAACTKEPSAPMCVSPTPGATASLGETVLRQLSEASPAPTAATGPVEAEGAQAAPAEDEPAPEASDAPLGASEAAPEASDAPLDANEAAPEASDVAEPPPPVRALDEARADDASEDDAGEESGTPLPEPSLPLAERTGLDGTVYVERVDASAEAGPVQATNDELTPFSSVASRDVPAPLSARESATHKRWTKIACVAAAGMVAWAILYYSTAEETLPKQQGIQLYAPEPEMPLPAPVTLTSAETSLEVAPAPVASGAAPDAVERAAATPDRGDAEEPRRAAAPRDRSDDQSAKRDRTTGPRLSEGDDERVRRGDHDERGCTSGVRTSRVARASL